MKKGECSMRQILVSLMAVLIFRGAVAAGGPGSTSANFLKAGQGVRPIAMGETYIALGDGLDTLYWNPAGLVQITSPQASFMHNFWFQDIGTEYLAYGMPLGPLGAVAGGLTVMHAGTIVETLEDEYGNYLGTGDEIRPLSFALVGTYAQKLSRIMPVKEPFLKDVLVGASLRLVTESLDEVNVFGGALDIGAIWRQTEEFKDSADKPGIRDQGWRLGLTAQNLGVSTDKLMPMNFRLGTGYVAQALFTPLGRGTAGLDILIPIDNDVKFTLGAEYAHISEHTESAIRMGYKVGPEIKDLDSLAGLTAGAGFAIQSGVLKYRLDYAFVPYGELGSTHRVSLTLTFLPSSPGLPGPKISLPTDLSFSPTGSLASSLLPGQEQEENLAVKRDKELAQERVRDEAKLKTMMDDIRNKIELVRRKLDRLNKSIKQGKLRPVRFQAGKNVLQRKSFETLDKIGEILEKHSQVKVRIEGHTDSDGKAQVNQRLSQKRVEAVKKYLGSIFELHAANLIPVGYGETHPIGNNKTPEGRLANRRVEIKVLIPAGMAPAARAKPNQVNAKKASQVQISKEDITSYGEIDKLREKLKVYEMQMNPSEVEEMFNQQHQNR